MALAVPIEKIGLFEGLQPSSIERIIRIANESTYPAETLIFADGDPAKDLYILGQGEVDLTYTIHSRSPVKIRVHRVMPGDVFGWSGLAGNEKFSADAVTTQESGAYHVPVEKLLTIMESDPVAGHLIMKRMLKLVAGRMHDLREEIRWFLSSLS